MKQRPAPFPPAAVGALEARFALKLTAHLSERAERAEPDIAERLRVAREQAIERARTSRAAQASAAKAGVTTGGAVLLDGRPGSEGGWWSWVGLAVPLVALVAGLVLIQKWYADEQISAAAEVDAALLADDLPPKAYGDAGFVEFLKTPRASSNRPND